METFQYRLTQIQLENVHLKKERLLLTYLYLPNSAKTTHPYSVHPQIPTAIVSAERRLAGRQLPWDGDDGIHWTNINVVWDVEDTAAECGKQKVFCKEMM